MNNSGDIMPSNSTFEALIASLRRDVSGDTSRKEGHSPQTQQILRFAETVRKQCAEDSQRESKQKSTNSPSQAPCKTSPKTEESTVQKQPIVTLVGNRFLERRRKANEAKAKALANKSLSP